MENNSNNQIKKLVVISNDPYEKDFYINDKLVYTFNKNDKIKCFELPTGSYKTHFFSQHTKSNSNIETLNLYEDKKIILIQGFINPKLSIDELSDEENLKYEANGFIKLDNLKSQTSVNTQITNTINKKKSPLATVGTTLLVIMLFCFFAYIGWDGAKISSSVDSDYNEKYSYTIESNGINENGIYVIKGKVTNNTNKDVDGLQIEFKCYDSEYNYINTIKSYTENLGAKEKWAYEAANYFDSDRISSCKFYKITPYVKIAEFH